MDYTYLILDKISFGGSSDIYTALSNHPIVNGKMFNSGNIVAIKIITKTDKFTPEELISVEFTSMEKIIHKNVLRVRGKGKGDLREDSPNGSVIKKDLSYIVMEYAPNGEIYNYVNNKIRPGFSEYIGRYIFMEMLNALNACHSNGICHRDIKLENFVFDLNFNVKLIDFGGATKIEGSKGDGLLNDVSTTEIYKAPELYESNLSYDGIKSDIFALAITFYSFITTEHPFKKYNSIRWRSRMKNDSERFWKLNDPEGKLSLEFKDLFWKMTYFNPKERISSVCEIMNHSFFKLPFPTKEEVNKELKERKAFLE
ncbi:MAG: serine/threonine-protein kinase [archaeon]|nr:serine/threonine-protein kinase [archaeon]